MKQKLPSTRHFVAVHVVAPIVVLNDLRAYRVRADLVVFTRYHLLGVHFALKFVAPVVLVLCTIERFSALFAGSTMTGPTGRLAEYRLVATELACTKQSITFDYLFSRCC